MKRAFLVAVSLASLFHFANARLEAQASTPLAFFQNYFVTGDYVVGGTGLFNSRGVGKLPVSGVPSGADILAAFLYWQVVADRSVPTAGSVGATFRGHPLTFNGEPFAKSLGASAACPLSGGIGAKQTFGYRADVLRYFDVDGTTGKQSVNGAHPVTIPSSGLVRPLGASLVVVYRSPDVSAPLKAVVLYDGAYTMTSANGGIVQPIRGFYDGTPGPARLTSIVGSAQALLFERLRFNGALLATNPFRSLAGGQWDNPTFDVMTPAPRAGGVTSEVTVSADYQGIFLLEDCLSWSAMIYSTTVEDTDEDGLLDIWEESPTPLVEPDGVVLPDLVAMGATPGVKDIFVEIGYMDTAATSYGGVPRPQHSHRPGHDALKLIGDAFDRRNIRVHFDVGNEYPNGLADPYLVRGDGLARGGERIDESITQCARLPGDPPWVCQFSSYPGTVGWKSGYRFLRDQVLTVNGQPPAETFDEELCGTTVNGTTYACERRFDSNRHDIFRYALFAHALGLPQSEFPCLNGTTPVPGDANGACGSLPENPLFFVPRTNTGIGDFPGADNLITLGAFDDVELLPTGTPFMQASTLMHEFGHNFERRHGGEALEPNCKPTYLSVMNYLYQLRGLLDDEGRQYLDFSGTVGATVNELGLNGNVASPYRLGWYAPLAGSYLAGRSAPADRHCNGSARPDGDVRMVRIDARRAADAVDWDADNNPSTVATVQDVNYSGTPEVLAGSEDWSQLRMNQIGIRRNVGAVYELSGPNLFGVGPFSIGMGKGDLGKGDLGKGDLGKGDLGKGDLGKGDLGKGDLGKGDLGKGDLGKGDLGGGDLHLTEPGNPEGGEIDRETAGPSLTPPPIEFDACVVGQGDCTDMPGPEDGEPNDVRATFGAVGDVTGYTLYRVAGPALLPGLPWVQVASVPAAVGQSIYSLIDTSNLTNGAPYTFFAVATYTNGTTSDPSTFTTITAVNPLVARNDGPYQMDEDSTLSVPAAGVLANDDGSNEDDSITAALVSGPANAAAFALNANGSFTFTPIPNFHGSVSFTYTANLRGESSAPATVTITVKPVKDAPTIAPVPLPNQTIKPNASTPAIGFTIGDPDGIDTLTVSGSSSNPALVPAAGIVFGGTGASRTVTVTPAPNKSGAATITVTVTDGTASASTTFQLTVGQPYTFVPTFNLPPAKMKTGSTTSMKWMYKDGHTIVNSAAVRHTVTVCRITGKECTPFDTITNAGPGHGPFEYAGGVWIFTFKARTGAGVSYPAGDYRMTIVPSDGAYQQYGPFPLTITK